MKDDPSLSVAPGSDPLDSKRAPTRTRELRRSVERAVNSGLRGALTPALILVLLTVLISPDLIPTYRQINAYDEAKYIESGQQLLRGELRDLSWGPLVALVYAALHLIVGSWPNWFMVEAWAGRFALFLGLCAASYKLATQLAPSVRASSVLGVVFVSTVFLGVVKNPSDALFVALAALSLARLLRYLEHEQRSDLGIASALLALAVLSRFEGIVLLVGGLLAVLLARRPVHAPRRTLIAGIAPAALLLGGYLVAFRLTAPGLGLGIGTKSYDSFEVNQPISNGGTHSDRRELARSLYGSAEENRGSVLRAITRNPGAFTDRLIVNVRRLPDLYLTAFGRRLGPATLFLAAWGAYSLLHRGKPRRLALLSLWLAAPLVSLAFLPLHIARQSSALVLVLSAVGVTHATSETVPQAEQRVAMAGLVLLTLYGLLDGKLALLVVGLVLAMALLVARLSAVREVAGRARFQAGATLLLAAGFILRGSYSFPDYPDLRPSPEEHLISYLQTALPRGSRVLESLPLPALAAKMQDVSWEVVPSDLDDPDAFHAWLVSGDIRAVLVDGRDVPRPDLLRLVEEGRGTLFELGHRSEDGELRVFLVSR